MIRLARCIIVSVGIIYAICVGMSIDTRKQIRHVDYQAWILLLLAFIIGIAGACLE